jgi:pimeloyl-ACP methyl ester carboxylesterase
MSEILFQETCAMRSKFVWSAVMVVLLLPVVLREIVRAAPKSAGVQRGYAPVNGLKMYYEIHGPADSKSRPLVLLHGGGSTIETSFGKILPLLSKSRRIIAIEQQGHGHTADIDRAYTFEQSADDTAALLKYLKVDRADFYGYSNGGSIALQLAIRHPRQVRKLIAAAAMYKNEGLDPKLRESLPHASAEGMPAELREAYLKVAPHPEQLPIFVKKCAARMLEFQDWSPEMIQSITAPTLVMIGDTDIIRPEHAVEMYRLLPHAQLAILPGTDHLSLVNRTDLLMPIISSFLDAPLPK